GPVTMATAQALPWGAGAAGRQPPVPVPRQVCGAEALGDLLGCDPARRVKVLSVFGKTGDGKSHCLNEALCGGRPVFPTGRGQAPATLGVRAALAPGGHLLLLDTEGLLGPTAHPARRRRLLLRVLALSDVAVYRTRAERLPRDLFQFVGGASGAYGRFFAGELRALAARLGRPGEETPAARLGPAVLVFHETTRTRLLGHGGDPGEADRLLQRRLRSLDLDTAWFSCLRYVGTHTPRPPTDFSAFRAAALDLLRDTGTRAPRPLHVVYGALKALTEKFNGELSGDPNPSSFFPDAYFTCNALCLSCGCRCVNGMNHERDGEPHGAQGLCRFSHRYGNRVLLCKRCYERGREEVLQPRAAASTDSTLLGIAKFAWSGWVLECPRCGVVYRSRRFWYGNPEPEGSAARTQVRHVWPGPHTGRRVLDGVGEALELVSGYGAPPARAAAAWLADLVAPAYWRPNGDITMCASCRLPFAPGEQKHHCRACGEGFCHSCSGQRMPVPARGWGLTPVRVCRSCFRARQGEPPEPAPEAERAPLARRVTEATQTALELVSAAVEYPLGLVTEAVRPSYWTSDRDLARCQLCQSSFTAHLRRHHCRACGRGVCQDCSPEQRPVPSRGWPLPVRVCLECARRRGRL
uniref:FYVE-type domain-containing protein n=1 Tax=Ornithorhynchus anatinus TaxID=9258 RepID=A0A6I8NJ69_ORNAN